MWDNGFYSSSLFSSSLCFWKKFENWFDRRWLDLPREKDFKDKILFLFSLSLSKWKIDKEIVILIRARITFGGYKRWREVGLFFELRTIWRALKKYLYIYIYTSWNGKEIKRSVNSYVKVSPSISIFITSFGLSETTLNQKMGEVEYKTKNFKSSLQSCRFTQIFQFHDVTRIDKRWRKYERRKEVRMDK